MCIKTISTQNSIIKMEVDLTETYLYVACDNQNIYCYGIEIQPLNL